MRRSALICTVLHLILPFARAVSLTDFQKLDVDVSVPCAIAYDRTIPSCKVDDFESGAKCSSRCISGLNQIAQGVLDSCGGAVVGSSSLLGRIFDKAIISSLCPNNAQATSASQKQSTAAASATTANSANANPPGTTSSTKSSTAPASSTSPSATASSSSAAAQPNSSATTPASSSTTPASTSPAVASSASSSTSSAPAQTSQAQVQPGNGRSGMSVPQQQIAALINSGGGSPFDIVGYSAASHPSPRDLLAITLGAVLLLIGYLMR